MRHTLGSQPRREDIVTCCSGRVTGNLPGGTGSPCTDKQQGACSLLPPQDGAPSFLPQLHSLRAQMSGGSTDDWDHGSQHLFLQQGLAWQCMRALYR